MSTARARAPRATPLIICLCTLVFVLVQTAARETADAARAAQSQAALAGTVDLFTGPLVATRSGCARVVSVAPVPAPATGCVPVLLAAAADRVAYVAAAEHAGMPGSAPVLVVLTARADEIRTDVFAARARAGVGVTGRASFVGKPSRSSRTVGRPGRPLVRYYDVAGLEVVPPVNGELGPAELGRVALLEVAAAITTPAARVSTHRWLTLARPGGEGEER